MSKELTVNELINLNQNMLPSYKPKDRAKMERIGNLKSWNINDQYLVTCTLCNYMNEPMLQSCYERLLQTRLSLFYQLDSSADYSHRKEDYVCNDTPSVYHCANLNTRNKYGLYEYLITGGDADLVSDLWTWKQRDCLKYVSRVEDKITVSVGRDQLMGFMDALDALGVSYDTSNIKGNVIFDNVSDNTLVDISQYKLPFEPYQFQVDDATAVVQMKRALIGSEMGCGKTLVAIFVGQSIPTKKLVICPESLRLNWRKEILQVDPSLDVQILYSADEYHTGADWTIVGYITATKYAEQLKEFQCIFVDEAHNCKAVSNWGKPTSKRAATVIELSLNAEYCYLLTGTPLPSHNRDLYNILKMLKCQAIDFDNTWAFKNYGMRYCDGKQTYFGMDYSGNSNSKELHDLLSASMVRHRKAEVLPDLVKRRQFIPIEPRLTKAYKDVEYRLYNPTVNDTYMGSAMTGRKLLSTLKMPTAIEIAENILNAEQQVVIVTNFVATADLLKAHFKDNACEIRGGMTDEAKDSAINDFQSGKCKVCILNMQAGGVGITLTAASHMIMIDYDWTPANNIQTEDRICRPGQDELCNIYYVYCVNSVFDRIFVKMISDKSENISAVVDDMENDYDLQNTKEEASTYLYLLKQEIASTTRKEA